MNNTKDIIEKKYIGTEIEEKFVDIIANRKFSAVSPILIKGVREKSKKMTPIELMNNYKNKSQFFRPSELDLGEILEYNLAFFKILPHNYKKVQLSPINPLGTNSVITKVSQDVTLATTRNSEVNGDPTTALTLESAYLRKEMAKSRETMFNTVSLATVHRVLRLQNFDKDKGYMQHFNLFGIVSSGREKQKDTFIYETIKEHIEIWIKFIREITKKGYTFNKICVNISNINFIEHLINEGYLKRIDVNLNSLNDEYDLFKQNNIKLPNQIQSLNELEEDLIKSYNLEKLIPLYKQIEEKIIKDLKNRYKGIEFCIDFNRKAGLGYYEGLCYHIFAQNATGNNIQLADGGVVNWNQQLLSDKKELSVTSGFGAELIQKLFKREGNSKNEIL